jgi:hypothetical protein
MPLPFSCQKANLLLKDQPPFPSGRATVEAGFTFQAQFGSKQQACATIKSQNEVAQPTEAY